MAGAARRGELWRALKAAKEAGVEVDLSKGYINYTEPELEDMYEKIFGTPDAEQNEVEESISEEATDARFEALGDMLWDEDDEPVSAAESTPLAPEPAPAAPAPPAPVVRESGPVAAASEPQAPGHPGLSLREFLALPLKDRGEVRVGLNSGEGPNGKPIRRDSRNRVWYQDEIRKPAIPGPRVRKITRTKGTGTTVQERRDENGAVVESYEVSDGQSRDLEITTVQPSWQVGIYKDPTLPFKVYTYNGQYGFSYDEIVKYYGGFHHVPNIKQRYIGYALCYDIVSTREALEQELRDRRLQRIV